MVRVSAMSVCLSVCLSISLEELRVGDFLCGVRLGLVGLGFLSYSSGMERLCLGFVLFSYSSVG